MLERPTRGIWKWSLFVACVLTGLFYVLNYTGHFSQRFGNILIIQDGQVPSVTMDMVTSEFVRSLSRLSNYWSWVMTAKIVVALLLYFLTSWWIARRRASLKAGMLAGLWAGLFYGLINLIISVVLFLVLNSPLFSSGADPNMQAYFLALIIVDDVSGFLFGFVLYGLLPGIVGGVLGGLFGWLMKAPPETPVAAA